MSSSIDIIVEGNIGAGKSTFLKILQDYPDETLAIATEPVNIWEDLGLLQKFYESPRRWAYTFQSIAFLSRFSTAADRQPGVRILERSVFADHMCFASTQYDVGNMDDTEWRTYKAGYDLMIDKFPVVSQYDRIVYLRASPETCMRRIHERDRNAEDGIQLDYLRHLHNKYETWLSSIPDRVTVVDMDSDWVNYDDYVARVHADMRTIIAGIRESKK